MHPIEDSAPHTLHNLPPQEISADVLLEKYAKGDERCADDVNRRVAHALAQAEPADRRAHWETRFAAALAAGFVPAGRIQSAAGSGLAAVGAGAAATGAAVPSACAYFFLACSAARIRSLSTRT